MRMILSYTHIKKVRKITWFNFKRTVKNGDYGINKTIGKMSDY